MRNTNLGRKVSTEYAFNDLENYPEQYFVYMTGNVSGSVALEIGSRSDRGNPYVRSKSSGGYTEWVKLITSADFLMKTVSLTQVTVPANSGTTGSTTNISTQIPAGYKLLDARGVGSGNNGCYIYFFNVDGVNITFQLRNVTNAAITTTPLARLLLIPE